MQRNCAHSAQLHATSLFLPRHSASSSPSSWPVHSEHSGHCAAGPIKGFPLNSERSHDTGLQGPVRYGFTDAVAELFTTTPVPGGTSAGRVVRVDRNLVLVADHTGQAHLPYPRAGVLPATGDWVWLGSNPGGEPIIAGVLPRSSELSRKKAFEASSEAQVLGANMDIVGVVVPVDRPLTHNRLERTLVAAWDSGATPLVVITKADLADVGTTSSGR